MERREIALKNRTGIPSTRGQLIFRLLARFVLSALGTFLLVTCVILADWWVKSV